jgi:trk system potassium uptake protein TrkH
VLPGQRLLDALTRWLARWRALWAGAGHALWRRLTPPQLFVASFLSLVVLGAVGLRTLPGLYTGAPLGWVDALFTATSAVCVTGLVVVDTATYFTTAGQAFVLLLIQLGGLGMITFASVIILALGGRLSVRHESLSATGIEAAPHLRPESLIRDVLRFTFLIEGIGALALWLAWGPRLGWLEAIWPAVFHAVSAFCNAGFSTFSDNLIGFQRSPATLVVVAALVVTGGIGFLTLEELHQWRAARRGPRPRQLSLHTRLTLVTTAALLLAAWPLFALFEWRGTLELLPPLHRVVNALFMSATPRTAGFNAVDYGAASDSTGFLTIILMFIGGSPGSTAGGVKTTTVALLAMLAWSRFRGREVTGGWRRSIPEETVQRAVGLAVTAFVLVTTCIFLLTFTEARGRTYASPGADFLAYMFEAVSAFNTVGLTMGVTDELTTAGRWIAMALMFLGRVGPLTLAAALALAARRHRVTYRDAYEDVIVG